MSFNTLFYQSPNLFNLTSSDSSLTVAGSDAIINVAKATTWTAKQTFRAGAIGAGTAGVYLQSGPLMTTPEVGAIEFLTDKIYGTITTGGARKEFTLNDIALTSGRVPFATTNGRLTDSSGLNFSGSTLSLGVAASAAGVLTFFQSTGIQTTSITPSSSGSSINFILPNSGGTPGYPMVTNGSGALSFAVLGVAAGGTGSSVQLTQGSIVFAGASGVYTQDNPNLTWDSVGKKLTAGFDSSNSVTIAVGATGVISLDALGSGAKFSFLDDVETTKNFLLPTTTSTVGQIKINGNATFHTYGTGNLFIGYPSGNFTQTGIGNNVGLGINTLTSVTSGSALLAIGSAALQLATGATNSMGLGVQTFNALLTGTGNVAIGYTAAASLSVTNYATIIGASAALNATGTALAGATLIGAFSGPSATGAGNTLVGFSSGRGEGDKGSAVALTIGTYNTLIGYDSDVGTNSLNYAIALGVGAVVNASNTMAIGSTNATYAVRVGINMQTASAYLHLPAGLATAGFAPLKFTSGTVQTTAQAGVMEYNGNHYLTNSAIRFGVGGSLSTNTTSVGNIGIGEDDLMTYTVIANTLAVDGGSIRGRASGTITSNVNAKRLRVRFGATLVLDTGVAGIPVSQAIQWVLEFEIIRTGALTQKCSANLSTNNASLASYVGYSTAAETLSGAVVVKVTGEATTNNDVVQETMTVKFVPAPQA